ncbi:MAG: enoyl-CoA hydratase/isomerase family protein [Candidatus Hodarchaeota archaeon]
MDYKNIILEEKPPIAIIRINRPKVLNALNNDTGNELHNAFENCLKNDKIRAIVLTGQGRAFSAGGDVKGFKKAIDEGTQPNFIAELLEILHKLSYLIRTMEKPVIAAINGFAMGAALNLALACDILIAADTAKLSEAFANVGLAVDNGGTYLLPRLIGRAKALELIFTGKTIDAKEAERLGLINFIVPEAEFDKKVEEFALKLANGPPKAIATSKKLLEEGYLNNFETQLAKERENQIEISKTEDFKEGVYSFFEKRQPNYKGK